jgi:hypothetical protein
MTSQTSAGQTRIDSLSPRCTLSFGCHQKHYTKPDLEGVGNHQLRVSYLPIVRVTTSSQSRPRSLPTGWLEYESSRLELMVSHYRVGPWTDYSVPTSNLFQRFLTACRNHYRRSIAQRWS